MKPARAAAILVTLAVVASPRVASATDPQVVEWSPDWRRMAPVEVAGTFAVLAADVSIELLAPTPTTSRFRGGILFDNWVRGKLKGETEATQSRAQTVSTSFFKGAVLVPFVVDAYLGALSIHESSDVTAQMLAIDLEAFSLAGLVSISAEKFVSRARPFMTECGPDGVVRDPQGHPLHTCDASGNQSFFSGHSAAAATAAGLVCVEHQHLPLFGGGVADLVPCVLMIGVAGATGVFRLVGDDHWASDVITGWSVGFLAGYVLPSALHYGFGNHGPIGEVHSGSLHLTPTILPYQAGAGLGAIGTF